MVPIHGRPFLEYQIDWVKQFGFDRVLLLTGYLGERIEEHFQDGRRWGVSVSYSRESSPLGTAGALKLAEHQLDERFLLLNGDTYLPIDYGAMARWWAGVHTSGGMAVSSVQGEDAKGNVAIGADGYVEMYDDDGGGGATALTHVAAGALLLRKEILPDIREGAAVSLERNVLPHVARRRELLAYHVTSPYYDIGAVSRLRLAKEVLQ